MRDRTRLDVDTWWRAVFEVQDGLWSTRTVLHPHGLLDDYEGWYVAWRGDGVHVSAPSAATPHDVALLRTQPIPTLQEPAFWQAFAHEHGMQLLGPSTHFYIDLDPGPSRDVVALHADHLNDLETRVRREEWLEAGMAQEPPAPIAFGIVDDGASVASAVLNLWRGAPTDLGVAVAASHRGRGLGTLVAGHATSYAVREHGIARWRAAAANLASMRTAERVGFEPYATQLAIRRGSSAA